MIRFLTLVLAVYVATPLAAQDTLRVPLSVDVPVYDDAEVRELIDTLQRRADALESRVTDLEKREPDPVDPDPIDGLPNGLSVVTPDDWDPRDRTQITNPNPQDHPEFTAALDSPNLWWADSLRPCGNDEDQHQIYYGHRRKRNYEQAPRNHYDPVRQAMAVRTLTGENGLVSRNQTHILWPGLHSTGPAEGDTWDAIPAKMASVQWEYLISEDGWNGGKQFQVSSEAGNRGVMVEFKAYAGYGLFGEAGGWTALPCVRTYFSTSRYRNSIENPLTRPDGNCERCPIQPNLGAAGRNDLVSPEDHVSLGGNQYLMGDEHLSGWITITVTLDWRDPDNHKLWMHMKDDRTPRTLVIGIEGDGYPITWEGVSQRVAGLWVEFNNSATMNEMEKTMYVRNVIVTKDSFAWEASQ